MIKWTSLLFLMIVARTAFSQTPGNAAQVVADVSVSEFKQLMDALEGEVVVDLRTPQELQQQGKIPGAVEIDFFGANFEPALQALDRKKVYLLYCASGGRSGETAELMQAMGFEKVYNLTEGFKGWAKRNMPVTKK